MAAQTSAVQEMRQERTRLTADDLLGMPLERLDQHFREGSPDTIPTGRGKGTVIIKPGGRIARPPNRVLTAIFWGGKIFRPQSRDLKNLISPLRIPGIRAVVYKDPSWFDGAECIVLDYSRSSRVAGWIRDEIREVSPGLYLGLVYGVGRVFGGRKRIAGFALTFDAGDRRPDA
jgi:hypothetical protein